MEKNNSILHFARVALFGIILFIPLQANAWNRIVSLNPMVSEWVAEILGDEVAKIKLVGTSEYSNYPDWVSSVKTIGPYPRIQVEKVLSLQPDLVIASIEYNSPDQIEKLKKLKMNVVTLPKESFLEMGKWILELGSVLKSDSSASKIANNWTKSVKELKAYQLKKRAFFQIQFQPLITVGRESFLNDSFKLLGYENIFEKITQSYPKVSREAVLENKPDIVFMFDMVKNHEDLKTAAAAWNGITLKVLNGDDFSRCSPRLLKALKGMR